MSSASGSAKRPFKVIRGGLPAPQEGGFRGRRGHAEYPSLSAQPAKKAPEGAFQLSSVSPVPNGCLKKARTPRARPAPGNARTAPFSGELGADVRGPWLFDAEGDLRQSWYVYFYFLTPAGRWKRIRIKANLSRYSAVRTRRDRAMDLLFELRALLKEGYRPDGRPVALESLTAGAESGHVVESPLPFITQLENLLTSLCPAQRPKTRLAYSLAVRQLAEHLRSRGLDQAAPADLASVLGASLGAALQSAWLAEGLSPRTVNSRVQYLKALFARLKKAGVPTPELSARDLPITEGGALPWPEAARTALLADLERKDPDLYDFVLLIYLCFIRPGELVQLQVQHLSLESASVSVPSTAAKNRRRLSVALPPLARERMTLRALGLSPETYLFGPSLRPGAVAGSTRTALKHHELAMQRTGLPLRQGYSLYSWKHSGAQAAVDSGLHPLEIMAQMRHQSVEQLLSYLKKIGRGSSAAFASWTPS